MFGGLISCVLFEKRGPIATTIKDLNNLFCESKHYSNFTYKQGYSWMASSSTDIPLRVRNSPVSCCFSAVGWVFRKSYKKR